MSSIQQPLQQVTEAISLQEDCPKLPGDSSCGLTEISTHSGFSQFWLETVCSQLPGVHSAVLVAPDQSSNPMQLLARWPEELDKYEDFFAAVKYALKKRGEVCLSRAQVIAGQELDYFAKPINLRSRLVGVLVVKMKHLPASKHLAVFHSIRRSVKWLGLASCLKTEPVSDDSYSGVVGILASCFEQQSYQQSLMRMVAELGSQFNCERVVVAEMRGNRCEVVALSNVTEADRQSGLVRKIADAMTEAVAQDAAIRFPDPQNEVIQRAHQELAQKFGAGSIATLPLIFERKVFGAVTLLCSEASLLDDKTMDMCQQTLALLTPFLALKRAQERGIFARIGDFFKAGFAVLPGQGHPHRSGTSGRKGKDVDEMQRDKGLDVIGATTDQSSQRLRYGARIYCDLIDKRLTLINRVSALMRCGRPLLIETCSAVASEQVSAWLVAEGFEHRVFSAEQDSQDAGIIPTAGQQGAITVATNMAGCGTDVALGPGIDELGGLHVIALGLEAYRLDRQLYGRCARQGDPGSCEAILSLEDESLVNYFSRFTMTFLKVMTAEGKPLPVTLSRLLLP